MQITEVKHVIKVADVEQHPEWNKMVKFTFCGERGIHTDPTNRVYIITSDGEIIKIGGSADAGGIKGTLTWYEMGFSGNPDDKGRTLGVPTALLAAIEVGRKVEVYMYHTPTVEIDLPTLTGEVVRRKVSISYKDIEPIWVNDFKNHNNGKPPILNMQEAGIQHPEEMQEAILYYNSLTKAGKSVSGQSRRGKAKKAFTTEEKEILSDLIKKAVESYKRLFKNS